VRPSLMVAVAQPGCVPADLAGNAGRHAALVRRAAARVVVFPELSLTGYELADAEVVDPADARLAELREACAETNSVALAGAPVAGPAGRPSIGMLAIDGAGARVAYRKQWLSDEEARRFDAGAEPARLEVDGWGLGLAICKDTATGRHQLDTARLGIDAYVGGLVMLPEERGEQARRGQAIATEFRVFVAFASFAGPTGSGYPQTAGQSALWDRDGRLLAQAGPNLDELARAELSDQA
jgi:predicted amidohydrolase